MDEKITRDIFWLTPLPTVSFSDTVANPPPPPLAVLRIIWMAPFVITEILDLLHCIGIQNIVDDCGNLYQKCFVKDLIR